MCFVLLRMSPHQIIDADNKDRDIFSHASGFCKSQCATDKHYCQTHRSTVDNLQQTCYQQAIIRMSLHMAWDNLLTSPLQVAASKLHQNFQNVSIIIQKLAESAFNKL